MDKVLAHIALPDNQRHSQARHVVAGKPVEQVAALRLVRIPNNDGIYLMYLDEKGNELTDTWHQTIEAAFDQAEFEFGVRRDQWQEGQDGSPDFNCDT